LHRIKENVKSAGGIRTALKQLYDVNI
jgi:hypothetical protein